MRELPLQDIVTAHTDALVAHAEEFLPMIRYLLLLGDGPVTPERLASVLRWTPPQAEAFLQASGLTVDDEGDLQMWDGAGCALDRLLAPMLTGRSARVVSRCPASGRPIHLTVTPQGVDDLDPPETVASLMLPGSETRAETIESTICAYGHFFVDRVRAARWPRLHREALLLSVTDATHLARAIANAARKFAGTAQI
jgi:alkylmercury lyase